MQLLYDIGAYVRVFYTYNAKYKINYDKFVLWLIVIMTLFWRLKWSYICGCLSRKCSN